MPYVAFFSKAQDSGPRIILDYPKVSSSSSSPFLPPSVAVISRLGKKRVSLIMQMLLYEVNITEVDLVMAMADR